MSFVFCHDTHFEFVQPPKDRSEKAGDLRAGWRKLILAGNAVATLFLVIAFAGKTRQAHRAKGATEWNTQICQMRVRSCSGRTGNTFNSPECPLS